MYSNNANGTQNILIGGKNHVTNINPQGPTHLNNNIYQNVSLVQNPNQYIDINSINEKYINESTIINNNYNIINNSQINIMQINTCTDKSIGSPSTALS